VLFSLGIWYGKLNFLTIIFEENFIYLKNVIWIYIYQSPARGGLTRAGCGYQHLWGGCGLNLLRGGRGLNLLRVRGGRGIRNSSCGEMSVEPKHMNLISSKLAKHVAVLKLFASIAL